MTRFHSYAARVKHIVHHRSIQVHPDLLSIFMTCHSNFFRHTFILPNLRTAQLTCSTHNAFQAYLSLSKELRHLQLDLGFKARVSPLSNDVVSRYLEWVTRFSPQLERVSIRGLATGCLNLAVASLKNVKRLSLRLGVTLTAETLSAVTSFPCLSEFEVHAAHFDVHELSKLFHNRKFPSLQKLHVRANAAVTELFLHAVPNDNLHMLFIEIEDPTCTTVSWATMLHLICAKSPNTLRNLTIEHHTELDELNLEINTHISFTNLQILGGLHRLTRFVLDTTLPTGLCDHELELLLEWWPELEHLDLGSGTMICRVNSLARPLSSHSLAVIAKKSTTLTTLIIPVNISCADDASCIPPSQRCPLTRLTCVYPFPPTHTHMEVAKYLNRLFPSLMTVDGLEDDENQWGQTQITLQSLAGQPLKGFLD